MKNKEIFISIVNWTHYQHYKTGGRPTIWIKLYIDDILRGRRFFHLSEFERWVFIGLLLLAGKKKNKILYDKEYFKREILHTETSTKKLDEAVSRLKNDNLIAIKLLSIRYQNACLETETETETETEAETEANPKIIEIFSIFKQVNPTLETDDKQEIEIIKSLISKFGYSSIKKITEFAIWAITKRFAPVITTPYELKRKLASLKAFYDREKNKPNLKGREIIWK